MPNWCDTTIHISLRKFKSEKNKAKALKQFNEFVKKFEEANKDKKDEGQEFLRVFYPIPESLNITSGSTTDYGIAILLSQKYGEHSKIDEIMEYEWVRKNEAIKTRKDLIAHLTKGEHPSANLKEAQMAIENIEKYGCKDWYDWCVTNWGTKWDLDICDVDVDSEHMVITSLTAWSPCLEGVTKISEEYTHLHFRVDYSEPGVGFQGFAEIKKGICSDHCFEYDYSQDENEDDDDE